MIVQTAYSLVHAAQIKIINELRKFFTPTDPYYSTVLSANFWVGEYAPLVYAESTPGVPTSVLAIFDQFQIDDMKIPSIIVTSVSGPMKPSGFAEAGQKPPNTIDVLPTVITPVKVASTRDIDFDTGFANGQVLDTIEIFTGDRILIGSQIDETVNGVYIVQASGPPVRSTDFDTEAQFVQFTVISVLQGKVYGGQQFLQSSVQPVTLGVSNIEYNQPEFQEYVEISEPTITFGIRAGTTPQRAMLIDLLMFAFSNKFLIRGQLEKENIIFQPTSPGFIRLGGTSEEDIVSGGAYPKLYKADLSSTLWLQWNYRILMQEYTAASVSSVQNN